MSRVVRGKRTEDHLRSAACYWHGFCWPGSHAFGAGTFDRAWPRPAGKPLKCVGRPPDGDR